MKIRTEDIRSSRKVFNLDVGGMSQEAVDIFLDEIKKYFKDVEVQGDKIIYSNAHPEALEAWLNEDVLDLNIRLNLPVRHHNSMAVSWRYGIPYNEVMQMQPAERLWYLYAPPH